MRIFRTGLIAAAAALTLSATAIDAARLRFEEFKRIKADGWSVTGKNISVKGNVHISFGEFEIYADQAVVNLESRDIEAAGNIRLLRHVTMQGKVSLERLAELEQAPNILVSVTGISGSVWGDKTINVKTTSIGDNIRAERLVGNLRSGYFRFDEAQMKFKTFVCRAKSGERNPDGIITVRDAEISACNYLEFDNAHYSIGAGTITLTPHRTEFYGVDNIDTDPGDHTVLLTNGTARIYGVPVLWLPVFYKPKDESPGLFGTQFGKQSDWGYYLSMYKRFTFLDYPYSSANLRGDWYEKRGFGYGLDAEFVTEKSRTEIFAYSIYDLRPYETDDYDLYRLDVPHGRYDFRVSNLTHITPRLDFRGAFEYVSDYYFLRDFYSNRYDADPQPATYAALEQQFDHLSAALYFRPRVVKYFSTVEKLPEVRLDAPRQELFGTGLYYQGDMTADYMRMKWIDFDEPSRYRNSELRDYEAFRFDTTHFLYYPIRSKWFTLVPRAGFKLTAYSNSSENPVTTDDLLRMFTAANPQSSGLPDLVNYDHDGGSRVRFAGELGFEASTKIHNTWQNVRSRFLGLDGLRHVMRPYLNYTYISNPNVDRKYLYYFDDVDRIDEMNFVRLGLENRLQTRNGSRLREYFSMENFLDIHFNRDPEHEFNHVGALGTIIRTSPIKDFTLSTQFLVDIGGNNDGVPDTYRNGRNVGVTGLGLRWLNRWNISLNYQPIEDVNLNFSYNYNRGYRSRSAYSMGSTLTQIDAGSYFNAYSSEYEEDFTLGASFPITPDRRTMGAVSMSYDVVRGYMSDISFMLLRRFHCWELIGMLSFEHEDDCNSSGTWDTSFSVQARLTGLEPELGGVQNNMLNRANRMMLDSRF